MNRINYTPAVFALVLLCELSSAQGPSYSQQELEEWFFDDSDVQASTVNEGTLVFIGPRRSERVHHHHNTLTISDQSLRDGWVDMVQCHTNMDRVPAAQVVFRAGRVRGLRVVSHGGIARAWVEGHTVQLTDVGESARLCVAAQTHSLMRTADGRLVLRSGPFMRRFLDGYYPMHVSTDIRLATPGLCFLDIEPQQQTGFDVTTTAGGVHYEAWFEGRLHIAVRFAEIAPPAQAAADRDCGADSVAMQYSF